MWRSLVWLGSIATLGAGCADPNGAFDEFHERYQRTHEGGIGGGAGDAGSCTLPHPTNLSGDYLLVISPAFSPKTPILLLDQLSAASKADELALTMTLTAISAADRETPVGASLAPVENPVPAGAFSFDLGVVEVVGEADPIIPGAAIVASVVLDGELCAGETDFLCGGVRGQVTAPAELGLAGSTWTLSRLAADGGLPPVLINCQGDVVEP